MTEKQRIRWSKLADEYLGSRLMSFCPQSWCDAPGESRGGIRKCLFIKFWGLGSVVLTEPALRWLAAAHPEAEIHYLTFEPNAPLARLLPGVSAVHTLPFHSLSAFASGSAALLPRLRREKYDLILDGEFFCHFSGLLACAAAPSARRIGFARSDSPKSRIQTVSIPFLPDRHVAAQFLAIARSATTGLSEIRDFPIRPRLTLDGLPFGGPDPAGGRPYLVLNVNASPLAVERRWPRRRFVKLARWILRQRSFDVVLVGSRPQRSYVRQVEEELGDSERVHNLCGATSLLDLARLVRDASLLISNDSGPVHLASAFDVPTVVFFGPETPDLYGPLSSRKLVFSEHLWCSPCMSVENAKTVHCINDRACMKEIALTRVIERVQGFIEREVPAGRNRVDRRPTEGAVLHPA